MKKLGLALITILLSATAFGASFEGNSDMDKALVGNQPVQVTEVSTGEIYNVKMSYAGEMAIDTNCIKDRVQHGSIVYKCIIDEESNSDIEFIFWQQYGVNKMTIDLKTPNGLIIELTQKEEE